MDDLTIAIAGGGRIGLRTAQLLDDRGHKVVIIERDHGRCRRLNDEYVGTVIEGDASRPTVLRQADPDRCDVLAALTGDTATNLGVCMAAKEMTDVRTVMRLHDSTVASEYDPLVDDIVVPDEPGARAVVNALLGGTVRSLESAAGGLEILEVEVAAAAPAAGRRVETVSLPRGSVLVAASESGRVVGAETVLETGKRYVVAAESDVTDEVLQLLRG